ncbi:hypothetical protein KZH41_22585 [Pseudomonas sp. YeP6b]|uniref:hypothetical protein n=1 Tax=Pseudomonas sp. YeP6b TaxID=2861775 RepID=UPI0021D9AE17|nr:hypothetical protein [Pseudomonas sp. YeP6b]UXZ21252.1 hypothetical protein KZH41_22585 [Pseudomonas sp. YeP6b]
MLPKRPVKQISFHAHLDKNTTSAWDMLANPLVLVFIALVWLLSIDMHLSADGVEHLRLTLANKEIFIVNEARLHAYWLLQWPIEVAFFLGAHQLGTFVKAFAIGVLFVLVAPWILLSFKIRERGRYTSLCYLYLLAIASTTLPTIYILGTDHQVIIPLTFMASLLLSQLHKNTMPWNILALIFMFLLCKTYETNLIPLTTFLVYLIYTAYKKNLSTKTLFIVGAGILICLTGIYDSTISIIYPRDLSNRDSFVGAFKNSLSNPAFITFMLVLSAIIALQWKKTVAVLLLFAAALYQFYCYQTPNLYQFAAGISFSSRTLTLLFPSFFAVIILTKTKFKVTFPIMWFSSCVLAISLTLLAYPFYDFKRKVVAELQHTQGFVAAADHKLGNHPAAWPWTFPSISMVWQPLCAGGALLNPNPGGWQPYDPENVSGFGDYLSYKPWMYADNSELSRCL